MQRTHGAGRLAGIACGAGAGALWGLVFLAPELVRGFGPLQLTIGRYLAFGLLSIALVAPRWRSLRERLARGDWWSLAWLAFVGNTLYYVMLAGAVQLGGIALTSLVIGFLPVAVTIIGSRDRGAVPLARLAPSLILCAGGVVCIAWQATEPVAGSVARQWIGLACAIGALASWTSYAVGNSRCLARLHHVTASEWNSLIGVVTGAQALLLVPVSLVVDGLDHAPGEWMRLVAVSVGLAVIASTFGNLLWNRMSRLLPLTLVGQMILFETLFALLYGFVWARRFPTALEMLAFALLVASVTTCLAAHRRAR